MIRILRVAWLLTLLVAPGCGILMNGSRQRVPVEIEPRGATVLVYPERTRQTTPTVLELDRKRVYTLLIEHPGYQSEWVYLNRVGSPWIYADFAFIVFPAALYVDTESGGAFLLRPTRVKLELKELPDPSASGSGEPEE